MHDFSPVSSDKTIYFGYSFINIMKKKYKGVIFDCDGTLVDTLEDIGASMNRALKLRGFPELTSEEFRGKVGWGFKRLAFLSLPEEARDEETAALLSAEALDFYAEAPMVYSRIYPGIDALVGTLRQNKIKTVVLTNKPDRVTQKLIAGLLPPLSFDIVQGETDGKPLKPDPACVWELLVELDLTPAGVILVGDSEIDMETATEAGCFPMGVSWGYRSLETVIAAGARRIIDKPEELLEYF